MENEKTIEELEMELIHLKKINLQAEIDELKRPRSKAPGETRAGGRSDSYDHTKMFMENMIAKQTGKKVQLKSKSYNELLEDLVAGKYIDLQNL